jgi:hypothetical protein
MKTALNEVNHCPNCGKPMPAGALAGLCPACLLAQGAATDPGEGGDALRFRPPPLDEMARLFPQLEILGLLGAGGMGAVYKARQPALDRFVALKILPAANAGGVNFEERFNREARALARLSHPNIVAVHEFGQAGALHYFLMEFVDGANLRQLERAGRLAPREALQLIPQICDALQYAHDEGVVHRDIKPENVLVDRKGRVKIADFGLAKILGYDAEALRLTAEGQVMGTPHYMAPEQVERPLTVDHRADIYSLGVVLYEMLTGDLPLGKFSPPSRKVQVDVRFDEVVLRALENDPARRYQQASEVKTQVETITSTPVRATVSNASTSAQRAVRWGGFPLVIERDGARKVNWKEAVRAWAIIFGLLTIGFAFLSAITGRSIMGWLGVVGWPSVVVRVLIGGLLVAQGVRRSLHRSWDDVFPPTAQGTAILNRRTPWWRSLRVVALALLLLAATWTVVHAPAVIARFREKTTRPDFKVAQIAAREAGSGALVAELPNGGRVELLAIHDANVASGAWWLPDGRPVGDFNYELSAPAEKATAGHVLKDFVFRLSDLPDATTRPMIDFTPSARSMRSDASVLSDGQPLTGAWPWRVGLPESAPAVTIRVGLGLGQWRTILTHAPADHSERQFRQPGDPHWQPLLHQMMDNAGSAQVTMVSAKESSDWLSRLIAVDTSGVEHFEGSGATTNSAGIWVTPKVNAKTWTYTFHSLPLSAVQEFRVQVQPVRWIAFRDAALRPREQIVP